MRLELYRSIIAQLEAPEIIRLNYSGESVHYPWLHEAIRLARSTGATTELVTSLVTASPATVDLLVDAGLHRLSVSIHSLDDPQFETIYGHGNARTLRARLDRLLSRRDTRAPVLPDVDVAFVAMRENLAQLPRVVALAESLGIRHVSVHPVIRRSEITARFEAELTQEFDRRVREQVGRAASEHSSVSVAVARPERPPAQNRSAEGVTCEQNPWETAHILADGTVVACEVLDRTPLGDLRQQTLESVWNGPRYRSFRQQYVDNPMPACANCVWRRNEKFVRGWHTSEGDPVRWSTAASSMSLGPSANAIVHISGVLPPPPAGTSTNTLTIRSGTHPAVTVSNATQDVASFQVQVAAGSEVSFGTQHVFCPATRGTGHDLRRLGFALTGVSVQPDEDQRLRVRQFLSMLRGADSIASALPRRRFPDPLTGGEGISIIVPARDTPEFLEATLEAALAACRRVREDSQVVVVVSGVQSLKTASRFPTVEWILHPQPLDYQSAVARALATVAHPWVYLLNSDMVLDVDAVSEAAAYRTPFTFAIRSRIHMKDGTRKETNWTDLRVRADGLPELVELDPQEIQHGRGCLYVGGGSGLFCTKLLRHFIRSTRPYSPFYWEDAEWGALAWRYGYECAFCPSSVAEHGYRQTVSRYYSGSEASRVFERNRLLFHVRNLEITEALEDAILSSDPVSSAELLSPAAMWATIRARIRNGVAPHGRDVLFNRPQMRWKPRRMSRIA